MSGHVSFEDFAEGIAPESGKLQDLWKEQQEKKAKEEQSLSPVNASIPRKFVKRVKSGRWEWITKFGGDSKEYYCGIRRKSTGEEWYFDLIAKGE